MGRVVEEVAASLVREFLSRKGLKRTIVCMDEELPRTNSSINNRSDLRRILHLESLYKKNKAQEVPLKSMLEILVKEQMEDNEDDNHTFSTEQTCPKSSVTSLITMNNISCVDSDRTCASLVYSKSDISRLLNNEISCLSQFIPSSQATETHSLKSIKSCSFFSESERDSYAMSHSQENHRLLTKAGLSSEKKNTASDSQKNRTSRIRRGMMVGPIASYTPECNKKRQTRRMGASLPLQAKEEDGKDDQDGAHWAVQSNSVDMGLKEIHTGTSAPSEREHRLLPNAQGKVEDRDGFERVQRIWPQAHRDKSATSPSVDDLHISAMILDDIDDEEEFCELFRMPANHCLPQLSLDSHPMDLHTATALKEVLFGSTMKRFSEEWKCQSFAFSDAPDLRYGIVQKKGGPCGVLASVQACVLQKLLFERTSSDSVSQRLQPSNTVRTKCLSLAAAEILWRAGDKKKATVTVTSGRSHFIPMGHYKSEGVLETLTCINVENFEDLKLLLEQHIHQFESGPFGCILLTISAILSRSIEMVKEDMDVPTTTLIGAHGYCTQELVNLLLCGQAVSNVFNDEVKLDSGNGNFTLLKGIKSHSDIGLLSLYDHYNICKVGAYLQTPRFPIWVVCSESHFSVLFSLHKELTTDQWMEREFDLYYYDGLANQQEQIRLTISTHAHTARTEDVDTDLISPLEHCIRTKWTEAVVGWNDTEPIL